MVGQQHIVDSLVRYNISDLPKTVLIIGEAGSEQRDIAAAVASHFSLELVDVPPKVGPDELTSYQQDPVSKLYIIDLAEFAEKQQNQFLKFIEEPSQTVFIMLLAESTAGVLPTILNRCTKFVCAPYTEEQLKSCKRQAINPNELAYKICKTPGQLAAADGDQIKALYDLCNKIAAQIKAASYANALTIVSKINCGKDDTKFDFYQFFNMLEYVSFDKYIKTKNVELYDLYMYVNKAKQSYTNKKVAKESFMLNFLDGLWRMTH